MTDNLKQLSERIGTTALCRKLQDRHAQALELLQEVARRRDKSKCEISQQCQCPSAKDRTAFYGAVAAFLAAESR
jgi:hypothetical protein